MARVNIIEWITKKLRSLTGIVEDGDTATHAISAGKYVIWKGNPCKASSAISIGDALSSSNLTALTDGVCNDLANETDAKVDALNSKITNKVNISLVTINNVTITAGSHENKTLSFGETITGLKCVLLIKTPNTAWVFGNIQEWSATGVTIGLFNTASSDVTGSVIVGIVT